MSTASVIYVKVSQKKYIKIFREKEEKRREMWYKGIVKLSQSERITNYIRIGPGNRNLQRHPAASFVIGLDIRSKAGVFVCMGCLTC